ncbi:MAG: alkaline phosphatase family protein [Candidatus Bathycorpusculaceae bacterium]
MTCPNDRIAGVLSLLIPFAIVFFSDTSLLAFYASEKPSQTFSHAILFSWDGANSFFLFVHYREPDVAGHTFDENSQNYENAIIECDNQMGRILSILDGEGIRNSTAILVTTDHGFSEGGTSHSGPAWGAPSSDPDNYIIWIACSAGTVNLADATSEYWDRNDIAPIIYSLIGLNDYAARWSYIRGSALWDRAFDTRDESITSIELSSSEVSDGLLTINVSIENQGDYTEIPTLSAYYDGNLLAKKTLVYPDTPLYGCGRGESTRTITFIFNSTLLPPGDYIVSAEATLIAEDQAFLGKVYTKNETDSSDNAYINGTFAVVPEFSSTAVLSTLMFTTLIVIISLRVKTKSVDNASAFFYELLY